MHRFFLPPEWIQGGRVRITGPLVHQIRDVLRMQPGERIEVLDSSGWEQEVELRVLSRDAIEGEVVRRSLSQGEPKTQVTLYQALLKGSKFEQVLQKGTELGISAFVPMMCQRCMVELPGGSREARWYRIIREAAEQSRRGRLPLLRPLVPFAQACQEALGLSLIPWEGERGRGLRSHLREHPLWGTRHSINLFIGPEGGFSTQEIDLAQAHGILPISLGSRILRAETAGLVAAALILYEGGDLGD